jgi:uncharacterized RDD family membrane protein YckC
MIPRTPVPGVWASFPPAPALHWVFMDSGGGHVEVETPEHVVFHYELAGVMSRMIAGGVDLVIQFFIALAIVLGVGVVAGSTLSREFSDLTQTAMAIIVLLLFVDIWGYSVLFELFMRGRTPGKIWVGLRVIREGGYPLTAGDVVVRNLLRIADFLPSGYGLGLIVMCSNSKCKRIGDYVAGTIVIQDAKSSTPAAPRLHRSALARSAPESVESIRRAGVHQLAREHLDLIDSYLQRRLTLSPEARYQLARQIAEPIGRKLSLPVGAPERFLVDVLNAWREATKESP